MYDKFLQEIVKVTGIKPVVDICSDIIGSNSVAKLFYSECSNSLMQERYLLGKEISANVPFEDAAVWIKFLEELHYKD
jgi:hypothetical protein